MTRTDRDPLDNVVWLRRQALAEGYSDRKIAKLVGTREWHRVRRGAYTTGALWHSLSREDQHRVWCRAVLLTAHPSTVLSHVSAAVEWGADTWGFDLSEVHLTRTDGRCGRKEAGLVHHRGRLRKDEVVVLNGVPVTSAARSIVETCTITDVEPALVVANSLLHGGQVAPAELARHVELTQAWPGSLTTEIVKRLADERIESAAESRAWHLFWKQGIPRPEPQVEIHDETGRLVGRVDFAWPRFNAFVEMDGRLKYEIHRREGETLEAFLLREKRREELICALTGWVCIRITWEDLDRPRLLARRLRRIFESRAHRPA